MVWENEQLKKILKEGGVVVMPTDTIYGILGRAQDEKVVNRIYEIRQRAPSKPCIVLIGDLKEIRKFDIILTEQQKNIIKNFTESTSFVINCAEEKYSYLHRGTKTLALRLPQEKELRKLLLQVGPLVAPSANPEALPPSRSIDDAKKYFGKLVDLYIDGGKIATKASKIVRLHGDGTMTILRE